MFPRLSARRHLPLPSHHTPEAVRQRLADGPDQSYVRDLIYGAIDGTVTTFAIVAGVVGAAQPNAVALVLGIANLLADAGVPLLNQNVLLAGVNDTPSAQFDLWERLIEIRVMPYYLHLPDRVAGAAHFDVAEETGRQIIAALRERLPGYAVPRLVREVPGTPSKVVVA